MNEVNKMASAYRKVISVLQSCGSQIDECIDLNNGRYKIIKTFNGGNFLVLYKKQFFMTFGREFSNLGESGIGETINLEDLKIATGKYGVKRLIYVYPSGAMYSIKVETILCKARDRLNEFDANKPQKAFSVSLLKKINIPRDLQDLLNEDE